MTWDFSIQNANLCVDEHMFEGLCTNTHFSYRMFKICRPRCFISLLKFLLKFCIIKQTEKAGGDDSLMIKENIVKSWIYMNFISKYILTSLDFSESFWPFTMDNRFQWSTHSVVFIYLFIWVWYCQKLGVDLLNSFLHSLCAFMWTCTEAWFLTWG